MSPRGKQVSFRDIKGGLRTADDPKRTPARFFRELVNAEYDIRGRLVKSKGYSVAQFAPTGHVRDIKRLRDNSNNTTGYLVGSDRLYRTDSITAPVTSEDLSSCASKIHPNYSGAYYFLSNDGLGNRELSKAQISGANSIVGLAGIQPPADTSLTPEIHPAATGLWRGNGLRTWPVGVPYNANILSLNPSAPTTIGRKHQIVSGGDSGYQVVNPEYSVDNPIIGDGFSTSAQFTPVSPSCLFVWRPDPTPFITPTWNPDDPNYLTNPTNTYYNPADGTFRAPPGVTSMSMSFRFNGNFEIYYGWHAPQTGNPYPRDQIIWTLGTVPRATTRLISFPALPYWPAYVAIRSANGVGAGTVDDIYMNVTYASVASSITYTLKAHPTVLGQESFNRIAFPLRANNLTTNRSFTVEITQINNTSGSVLSEVRSISVPRATSFIDTGALTNTFQFDGTGTYTTKIKLFPSVVAAGESVQLQPSRGYFVLGEGQFDYVGPSPVEDPVVYPEMMFRLSRTWTAGIYEYSAEFQDYQGFRSNYFTPVKRLVPIANDTIGISVLPIIAELTTKPSNEKYIIGRTLVGGGTVYQLAEYTLPLLSSLVASDLGLQATPDGGTLVIPSSLLDFRSVPSGIPLDTDLTPPDGLNFVEDSLKVFRRRLWGIVKIPDAFGTIRTFIRYSDVEGFDYWNPLNELSLQDDLIEIQPFRDDVLLAFSESKVYRIIPVGDQFTYEKLSDTGIGGIGMSVATHDLVMWYNIHGAWVFDGAQVIKLAESEGIIEQIQEMVAAGGRVWSLKRENQIWFCHVIPGGFNRSIILSTLLKNFVFRHSLDEIVSIIEEDGLLTSTVYYGLDSGIGIRSTNYLDRTAPIISTIRTKRFCSRDVNDLRLQYMAINRRNEASGVFVVSTIFANGRTITKTRSLTGSEAFMPYLDWFEVYGTDAWFEILITHTSNTPFELLDYVLGAYPIDLAFDSAESVKENDSGA